MSAEELLQQLMEIFETDQQCNNRTTDPMNQDKSILHFVPDDLMMYIFHQFISFKNQIYLLPISKSFNSILQKSIKQYPLEYRMKTKNDEKFTNFFEKLANKFSDSVGMDRMDALYDNNPNMLYNRLIHVMFGAGGSTVGAKYDAFQDGLLPQSLISINIPVPYITFLLSTQIKHNLRFLFVTQLENIAKKDHFHFSFSGDDDDKFGESVRERESKEFNDYIQNQFKNLVLLSLTTWFYCCNIDIFIPTQIQSLFLWRFDQNHPLTLYIDQTKVDHHSYNLCEVKIEIPIWFDQTQSKCLTVPHWYKNMETLAKLKSIRIIELKVIIQHEFNENWPELYVFDQEYHEQLTVIVSTLKKEQFDGRVIHEARDVQQEEFKEFLNVLGYKYFPKSNIERSANIRIDKSNFEELFNLYDDYDWMVRDRIQNNMKNISFDSL